MSRKDFGNGTIYFSEQRNRWVAQCKIGVDANGKAKRKTIYGKTKKEVKDKINQIKAELLTGLYIEPSKVTIVDLASSIIENKKAANTITANTYKRYTETLKKLKSSNLNVIPIQNVSNIELNSFLNSLTTCSNSVIDKVFGMLNATYEYAIKIDLVTKNPMKFILKPKSQLDTKKVRALTIKEQKAFIEALNKDHKEPYRTMLLLSLFTGMRMGEVAAIEYSPFILKSKSISVKQTITRDEHDKPIIGKTTKTDAGRRIIKLDDSIVKLLTEYIDNYYRPNDFNMLFISKADTLITTSQVNSYYKRLFERYNIADWRKCNQHQLRHTYATRCIEADMPPKVLQKILGHNDISTTLNIYTDVCDDFELKFTNQASQYLKDNGIAI